MDNRKKCCSNCRYHFLHKCENLKSNEDFKKLNMRKDCNKYYDFLKKYVCENFDSMYIQYPTEINGIETNNNYSKLYSTEIGRYCKVRYCDDNKTYLGLFLGELPYSINTSINRETKILKNSFISNPAIFVFDLNKIIFGFESWWSIIYSKEDLKEITDNDINNVWYVQALKDLSGSDD